MHILIEVNLVNIIQFLIFVTLIIIYRRQQILILLCPLELLSLFHFMKKVLTSMFINSQDFKLLKFIQS